MSDEIKETIVIAADANGGISPCPNEEDQEGLGAHPQGVSNTPVITSNPNQGRCIEAIVDYLKVVFLYPYEESEPETMKYWNEALDALLIDTSVPEGSDTPKGADGTTDLSGAEAKKSFFYDEEGW